MRLTYSRNIRVFFREGVVTFCRNPLRGLFFLRDSVVRDYKLASLFNSAVMRDPLRNEFAFAKKKLGKYVESKISPYAREGTVGNMPLHPLGAPLVYEICRLEKPDVVVETGVAAGVSTTYILQALEDNGKGTLYSVDLPGLDVLVPKNRDVGWLVPEALKGRWRLTVGSSEDVLLPLLKSIPEVDLFLHDSGHSYSNMIFEFKSAWRFIRDGGLLLTDDVIMNKAFFHFARLVKRRPVIFGYMGAIRK